MGFKEYQHRLQYRGSYLKQLGWELPGIKIGFNQGQNTQPGTSRFHNDADLIRLHVNLSGGYDFHYRQLGKTFRVDGGRHNLMYSPSFTMELEARSEEVETFGIQIEKATFLDLANRGNEHLKRLADKVDTGQSFMATSKWGGEDVSLWGSIRDLRHHRMTGEMKRLWVESKTIAILDKQVNCFHQPPPENHLSSREVEQMYAARDFLVQNLLQPPRLKAVAQAAVTNEFKLKRNFKLLFGTSVYGFVQRERLVLAARCIQATATPIGQLAMDLGYSSPQHFSLAFRKQFGTSPRSFRHMNTRQRKDLIPIV